MAGGGALQPQSAVRLLLALLLVAVWQIQHGSG